MEERAAPRTRGSTQRPSPSGTRARQRHFQKKKTESGRNVTRDELTCVEEGGDGHAADQVLQQQALSSDQDGHKGRQRVVEGQVTHLKKGARR